MHVDVIQSKTIGIYAAYHVSQLMYEKHIYDALCDEYRDLFYAHRMLSEIESGERAVLLVRQNNVVVGCIHGVWENEGDFVCHIMFKRHVNALKACLLCEKAMKKFRKERNLPFNRIIGHIWEGNRPALALGKKYGAVDTGVSEQFIWMKGYLLPCRKLVKEIV
jgi:hypothetical protein